MSLNPPSVPPGWYDDPENPLRLRYFDGSDWTDHTTVKAPTPAPRPEGRSSGRTVGGVFAIIIAGIAMLVGYSWLTGYYDLTAKGNQFASMLLLLALGAGVVAAGFLIWGIQLLSKPKR